MQHLARFARRSKFHVSILRKRKTIVRTSISMYLWPSRWEKLVRFSTHEWISIRIGIRYTYILCTVLFYRSLLLLVRSFCWSLTSLTIWLLSHMVLRTLCILDQPRTLIHAFLVNPSIPNRRKARVGLWKKSFSFLNKSPYVFAFFISVHICSSSLRNEVRNRVSGTLDE